MSISFELDESDPTLPSEEKLLAKCLSMYYRESKHEGEKPHLYAIFSLLDEKYKGIKVYAFFDIQSMIKNKAIEAQQNLIEFGKACGLRRIFEEKQFVNKVIGITVKHKVGEKKNYYIADHFFHKKGLSNR